MTKVKSREEKLQEEWLEYFKNIENINDFKRTLIEYYILIESKVIMISKYNIQLYNIEQLHNNELDQYIKSIKESITLAKNKLENTVKFNDIDYTKLGWSLDEYRNIINHYSKRLKTLDELEKDLPNLKPRMEQNKINSLYLGNFKGFSEDNDKKGNTINIKPITLIYGPNSYGKSSILQSLLLLNQTVKYGEDYKTIHLLQNGNIVKLGAFQEFINKKDIQKELKIKLKLPPDHYISENEDLNNTYLSEFSFCLHFKYEQEKILISQIEIFTQEYDSNDSKNTETTLFSIKLEQDENNKDINYKVEGNNLQIPIEILRTSFFTWGLPKEQSKTQWINPTNAKFLKPIKKLNQLENVIKNLIYVSSYRTQPERYYVPENNKRNYVGKNGEYTSEILGYDLEVRKYVDKWLNKIAGYKLSFKNKNKNVNSVNLNDEKTEINNINILDLGSGIAQVLPIITQAFKSENEMILIEEPEIHLHPRAQAELGEMFADAAKEKNNTFIIETHSENLLLRLQKLIRRNELSKDDVSVIYVNKDETGSHCIPLKIDAEGDIINISDVPDGFFEEGFDELFDIDKDN